MKWALGVWTAVCDLNMQSGRICPENLSCELSVSLALPPLLGQAWGMGDTLHGSPSLPWCCHDSTSPPALIP